MKNRIKVMLTACFAAGLIMCGCTAEKSGLYQINTVDVPGSDNTIEAAYTDNACETADADNECETADTADDAVSADNADSGQMRIIYVHVCGEVNCPGVYEFNEGDRVYSAIEAAGGFTENACESYVNLAEELTDGSKIVIPNDGQIEENRDIGIIRTGENVYSTGAASSEKTDSHGADSGLVNINTASEDRLCTLSGIGKSKAEAIIKYRENAGGFSNKEEIKNVSGIGDGIYAKLKDEITVE